MRNQKWKPFKDIAVVFGNVFQSVHGTVFQERFTHCLEIVPFPACFPHFNI